MPQVWRPEGGTTYRLVCEDAFNAVSAPELLHIDIPTAQQCTIRAGDVVGFYHPSNGVISYDNTDNDADQLLIRSTATMTNAMSFACLAIKPRAWSHTLLNKIHPWRSIEWGGDHPKFIHLSPAGG